MTEEIPAFLRSAHGRLLEAIAECTTSRIHAARIREGDWDNLIDVTDELMERFASTDDASPGLRTYAERVRDGDCRWSEIESRARPIPPEVERIKSSGIYRWYPDAAPPPVPEPEEPEPYRIAWQ